MGGARPGTAPARLGALLLLSPLLACAPPAEAPLTPVVAAAPAVQEDRIMLPPLLPGRGGVARIRLLDLSDIAEPPPPLPVAPVLLATAPARPPAEAASPEPVIAAAPPTPAAAPAPIVAAASPAPVAAPASPAPVIAAASPAPVMATASPAPTVATASPAPIVATASPPPAAPPPAPAPAPPPAARPSRSAPAVLAAAPPELAALPIASPAAEPPAPPRPAPAPGLRVQITAAGSEAEAQRHWDSFATRLPDLAAGRTPIILRLDRDNAPPVFRLRLGGFANREEAERFCARLAERQLPCWISG